MAKMNENVEKMNFYEEENREETAFDEAETEEAKEEMKSSAKNVTLTPYDELFCSDSMEVVQEIRIDRLFTFNKHPFRIYEDEEMEKLIQSIAEK